MTNSCSHVLRLADFLPYQLSVTSNAISNGIADVYRSRFGLKVAEWRVMAVLGDSGAMTQRDLTEKTLMDKVAVNRACKVLEERGLAGRKPNALDGRSHLLALTKEGCEMHDQIVPLAMDMESRLLAPLSDRERQDFSDLLKRLFAHSNEFGPASQSVDCGAE